MKNRVVYKYPLNLHGNGGIETISFPGIADVRHVGVDPASRGDCPTVWVEHEYQADDQSNRTTITFVTKGTGHIIEEDLVFLGSVVTPAKFVWHVYRKP